jgi:hypothetical protein
VYKLIEPGCLAYIGVADPKSSSRFVEARDSRTLGCRKAGTTAPFIVGCESMK